MLAIAGISVVAFSQPGGNKKEMLNRMTTELNLSPDQKAKVETILNDSKAKSDAVIAKYKGDREAAKPEMKAIKKETDKRISGVLTPEQNQKFAQMKEDRRDEHMNHPDGPAPAQKPQKNGDHQQKMEELKSVLQLTPEQEVKFRELKKTEMEKKRVVREKYGNDREAAKPEMQAINKESRQALKSILTPEQIEKLKEYRRSHKEENDMD